MEWRADGACVCSSEEGWRGWADVHHSALQLLQIQLPARHHRRVKSNRMKGLGSGDPFVLAANMITVREWFELCRS